MSESEQRPTPLQLFLIFSRVGLTSFGGGTSGWLLIEFVQRRPWMTEEEFFNGLSISQALPGVNVKNMAVWIGYHLRGTSGAVASMMGILLPPAVFIVLLGTIFAKLARFDLTHIALEGAVAGAVGLSATMGLVAAWKVPRKALPMVLMTGTFVCIAILRMPLVWTVLAAGVIGVVTAYLSPAHVK